MKAMVLSSGGLDSTTCLALAVEKYGAEEVAAVSIDYGQKHSKELECARKIAEFYKVPHYELNLREVFKNCRSPLMAGSGEEISHKSYSEQISESQDVIATYIPFRNGLFLSAVASLGLSVSDGKPFEVYLGNHADDTAGNAYADCSVEFIDAMSNAISIGTYGKVSLVSPFAEKTKADIVAEGLRIGVPYQLTWSCYEGGEKACGVCGTCRDRLRAFTANNAKDPISYE